MSGWIDPVARGWITGLVQTGHALSVDDRGELVVEPDDLDEQEDFIVREIHGPAIVAFLESGGATIH